MRNCNEISIVCEQLCNNAEGINALACNPYFAQANIEGATAAELQDMVLQQLEHIQRQTILLTRLITDGIDTANADEGEGSAFGPGELTDNLGDKTDNEEAGGK